MVGCVSCKVLIDIVGGFQHTFHHGPYEFVPGLHYIANLPLCAPLYEMVATSTEPPLTYHQAGNSVPADKDLLCSHDLQVGLLPPMKVCKGPPGATRMGGTKFFKVD